MRLSKRGTLRLGLCLTLSATAVSAADEHTVPVILNVVGTGSIRVLVSDGSARPCDSSTNRLLFDGQAIAGDEIKLSSSTGSVCVDHTFGEFRETEWAGPSILSGARGGPFGSPGGGGPISAPLRRSISTDQP